MKRVFLIILFVLCLNNYSFGQTQDFKGWNNVQWGMTVNEVLKVLDGKATSVKNAIKYNELKGELDASAFVVLDEIEIARGKYRVEFVFNNAEKKLITVLVQPKNETPSESQYSSLKQILIKKHGTPSFVREKILPSMTFDDGYSRSGSTSLQAHWSFPSTIIMLEYFHFKSSNLTILNIAYQRNVNKICYKGPFGLCMGIKKPGFRGELREIRPHLYQISTVPQEHSAFESYVVKIGPESGLCQIKAVGKDINTNTFGLEVKWAFDSMESKLKKSYGEADRQNFLLDGSFLDEPKDWMPGLIKKERILWFIRIKRT